ncbi:hypothetical protein E2C01_078164 [Portunus trituberculatus]|uniref:Secreted protein n=1 Tax=Portunus trituberculatus TaxID=210409 RepID=A0A5B7ILX3_PORTR|nr:hypothetical protein [Portunus trituberculatus]
MFLSVFLISFHNCVFIPKGGGGVVDKMVSVGSGRGPRVGSNYTTYRYLFEAMPFVELFKGTNMSPRYPGSRCAWVMIWALIWVPLEIH